MTIFNIKNKPTWPATDADFGPGGVYDQNTEAGMRAYEHAYFDNEPKLHTNAGDYMPTLMGYQWLTVDRFSDKEIVWANDEYYRLLNNTITDGSTEKDVEAITAQFQRFLDELKKRGIDYTPPKFEHAPLTVPFVGGPRR